jgi:Holliday junction resolvasome RuvABC endonuclease subunit
MNVSVIGLDLSMTSSGICSISITAHTTIVDTSAIKSKPAPIAERTANVRARRLNAIVDKIKNEIEWSSPSLAVVESPVPNGRMKSAMLLERGAIYWSTLMLLDRYDIEIVECSPRERALFATGDGAADKMSVARTMLAEHDRKFATDDECDAFVLAQIGLGLVGQEQMLTHRQNVVANLAAKRGRS